MISLGVLYVDDAIAWIVPHEAVEDDNGELVVPIFQNATLTPPVIPAMEEAKG